MNTYRVRVTVPGEAPVIAEVTAPGWREAGDKAANLYRVPVSAVEVESDPRIGFHRVFT